MGGIGQLRQDEKLLVPRDAQVSTQLDSNSSAEVQPHIVCRWLRLNILCYRCLTSTAGREEAENAMLILLFPSS